jgi:hypothetical protein
MFDRNIKSWHDLNPVKKEHRELYKDDLSAKYLAQVYYPDFALRMRERILPVIRINFGMFQKVNHKKEVF